MSDFKGLYGSVPSVEDYIGNLNHHSEFLQKIINEEPSKVLEVGVGAASMTSFLSKVFDSYVGVDNDEEVLLTAEDTLRVYGGEAEMKCVDAFDLSDVFELNEFDLVFSQGLLEHFDNKEIEELVSEMTEVGEVVFVSVPSPFYPQKDVGDETLWNLRYWEDKRLKNFDVFDSFYYGREFVGLFHSLKFLTLRNPLEICLVIK